MQIIFDPERADWKELEIIMNLINKRIDKLEARDERHTQIVNQWKENMDKIMRKYHQ